MKPGRPQPAADVDQAFVADRRLQIGPGEHGVGEAGQDRLHVPTLGQATGVDRDQLDQRGAHRDLDDDRTHDVAHHRAHHRPRRVLRPDRAVPLGAQGQDVGDAGQGLDVVDQRRVHVVGRLGVLLRRRRPAGGRPRGEEAVQVRRGPTGQRLLALDDLQQGGLLPHQVVVGPGGDLELDPRRQPLGLHLLDGLLDPLDLLRERVLQPDVGLLGPDRDGGDRRPLDHLVRVGPQDGPVLEGPRLALAGVDHDVAITRLARGGGDGAPLAGRGKARSTPAPQPGQAELLQRPAGSQLLGPVQADAAARVPPVGDGGHVAQEERLVHRGQCAGPASGPGSQAERRRRSKLTSGLPHAWWSDTASTLDPSTRAVAGTV